MHTSGAGTAYNSEVPEFTTVFSGVRVVRSLVFCEVLRRSLFVLLLLFSWSLCCLSFDLRILITLSYWPGPIWASTSSHANMGVSFLDVGSM
jgi:hypothetical protein